MIRELANGRGGRLPAARRCSFPWVDDGRGWRSGSPRTGRRRWQLTGEVGDGFILQLADPDIAAWMISAVREAAAAAGRDPASITICVAAPAYVGDDLGPPARAVPLVRRDGRQPRRRHRRPLRRPTAAVPQALTDYIAGRQGYDYNEHGRAGNTHTDVRAGRDRRPVLHPRPGRGAPASGCTSCAALGVDQFAVYLQHDAKDATLAAYGEQVIPAVTELLPARS